MFVSKNNVSLSMVHTPLFKTEQSPHGTISSLSGSQEPGEGHSKQSHNSSLPTYVSIY